MKLNIKLLPVSSNLRLESVRRLVVTVPSRDIARLPN